MPSILLLACAAKEGETSSPSFVPTTAAAPAKAAPTRNLRRFKYKLWDVISDDGMSAALRNSMESVLYKLYGYRRPLDSCAGAVSVLRDRTQLSRNSYRNRHSRGLPKI